MATTLEPSFEDVAGGGREVGSRVPGSSAKGLLLKGTLRIPNYNPNPNQQLTIS